MNKRPRGRPKGSSGSAISLSPDQIKRVLKLARSERYADRAELLLSLSIQLGMRAIELASLKWIDIYDSNGTVRPVIAAKRAFLPGKRSQFDISSHPNLQKLLTEYHEKYRHPLLFDGEAPLFPSQRGSMTATSIARYLTDLYRRAGIMSGSSRSGRQTMLARSRCTL
jgi:integrase/recombinase XerD